MEIIYNIILTFLVICFIYLFYKTNKIESFDTTLDITNAVNNKYKSNINTINKLSDFVNDILNNSTKYQFPVEIVKANNLKLSGSITIDGNGFFTNKNDAILEIYPKYMIIAWANKTQLYPNGWAPCDGKYYTLINGIATIDTSRSIGIQTPDLRGRFILGAGNGMLLTPRNFNDPPGGTETHVLTIDELPQHTHPNVITQGTNCFHGGSCDGDRDMVDYHNTTNTGETGGGDDGTAPHNNMPPFYVLIYIMKL